MLSQDFCQGTYRSWRNSEVIFFFILWWFFKNQNNLNIKQIESHMMILNMHLIFLRQPTRHPWKCFNVKQYTEIHSETNSLTDFISVSGSIQMTVSDSWSMSRRRKSTASSGGWILRHNERFGIDVGLQFKDYAL